MNVKAIRAIYFVGLVLAIVLFAAMVWDHFGNSNDLFLPLAAVFAVLAIVLLLLLLLKATEKQILVEFMEDELVDYPGDVHQAVDLEGIGPVYAERLEAAGIQNTQQLLFADTKDLSRATGAPVKTIKLWKAMSQLVKVNGIGPQYAEALARSGIEGIEDLAERNPKAMATAVATYLEGLKVTVVGQLPGEKRITTWQKEAAKMEKVPIDMANLKIMPLESKQAISEAS